MMKEMKIENDDINTEIDDDSDKYQDKKVKVFMLGSRISRYRLFTNCSLYFLLHKGHFLNAYFENVYTLLILRNCWIPPLSFPFFCVLAAKKVLLKKEQGKTRMFLVLGSAENTWRTAW